MVADVNPGSFRVVNVKSDVILVPWTHLATRLVNVVGERRNNASSLRPVGRERLMMMNMTMRSRTPMPQPTSAQALEDMKHHTFIDKLS